MEIKWNNKKKFSPHLKGGKKRGRRNKEQMRISLSVSEIARLDKKARPNNMLFTKS